MDDDCPSTPAHVLPESNSKSPNLAVSSPESEGRKSPGGRKSPDSSCAICLGKLQNKAFTDICLHQFCFQCLVQWSKVKPECPLCKQPIKSIIYNVRSNLDYDQYNVEKREPAYVVSEILHSYDFDLVPVDTRVRYRSTMTREYFGELGFLAGARTSFQMPNFVPTPPTFHIQPSSSFATTSERRISRSGSDFRRRIYEEDLWVRDLSDITGRYRECTPQFYRENPAQIHRIIPWLNREINSLMDDNESYTAYILDRILTFLPQYSIDSLEFRSVVEPYFGPRTEHFIHEFHTFCRSVYDVSGFDQHASYAPNPNYATEVQEISSSNDDSDIEVIRTLPRKNQTAARSRNIETRTRTRTITSNFEEPVAGPSGINNPIQSGSFDVPEDDSDDVKIIEHVKPQPEVVILSSGEEIPSSSDTQRNKSNGNQTKVNNLNNSVSGSRNFSDKESRSCSRFGKNKNKPKRKSEEHDVEQKNKSLLRREKRKSSASSSSSSLALMSAANSTQKPKGRKDCSLNAEGVRGHPTACSSIHEGSTITGRDFDTESKSKKKTLSKGYDKKVKKVHSHKHQHKGHSVRKNKIKSCVVVPTSGRKTEIPHTFARSDESTSQQCGDSRTGNDASSASPSYWSLRLNNNAEKSPWWNKNNVKE